ncbi:MAG: SagB/ThcOx family dehydrogenase [Bacteroidota bacterium]|jgi:nitroreductase
MIQKMENKTRSVSIPESNGSAQKPLLIELPKPMFERDSSMFKALQQRKTIREISDKKLSLQILSNLLWAAYGVNRKKGPFGIPGRTAASASNSQEIDIYVIMQDGIYLYDAFHHHLALIVPGDLRTLAIGAGQVNFVAKAPVQLIYIVDVHKLSNTSGYQEPGLQDSEIQKSYYYVDTGLIAGNVYLFAASQGLASWFHNCNKPGLTEKLKLRAYQLVLFGQTVGYPAKK